MGEGSGAGSVPRANDSGSGRPKTTDYTAPDPLYWIFVPVFLHVHPADNHRGIRSERYIRNGRVIVDYSE